MFCAGFTRCAAKADQFIHKDKQFGLRSRSVPFLLDRESRYIGTKG